MILEQIDKIKILRENMIQSLNKFHKKIEEILTVVQMGKMIIFEERFERELLKTVRGFRDKHAPMTPGDASVQPNTNFHPFGQH